MIIVCCIHCGIHRPRHESDTDEVQLLESTLINNALYNVGTNEVMIIY